MIEGLQIEKEYQNGKVWYEPVVLTVSGVSKFRDDEISFVEIRGFWSIRFLATHEFNKGKQEDNSQASEEKIFPRPKDGSDISDGQLFVGDTALFKLDINPKRGANAAPGSFYHNISSVMPANGEAPMEQVQSQSQPAPQSGGSWASDTGSSGSEPYVDKWDLKDIHIRKAQALNILNQVLTSGDTVNAPKIVVAMGFTDADEAIAAVANGWNSLRRGLPIEFPVAVSDMEEDNPIVEDAVDLGADVIEEDVETVSWD